MGLIYYSLPLLACIAACTILVACTYRATSLTSQLLFLHELIIATPSPNRNVWCTRLPYHHPCPVGVLVEAMRQGHWVILDELNLAPTEVLEALNRVRCAALQGGTSCGVPMASTAVFVL